MFLLLVIGCNKPNQGVSIAFEELGGEVGLKKGNEQTNYRSSVSVSGLGQNQIVGSILTVPGRNIPDTYSIPIVTGCSKVAETIYGTEATLADVKKVRKILDNFVELNTKLVVLESEQFLLKELTHKFKIAETNSEDEKSIKRGIVYLYPFDIKNSDKKEEILKKLKNKSFALTDEIGKLDKNISLETSRLRDAQNKNGLIITNWSNSYESRNSGILGTFSSVSGSKEREKGGYLVLAGIRSASLWLGDDFAAYIKKRYNHVSGSDSIMSDHGYIVTFALMAKHRAYSESLDYKKALFSRLDAKIENLAKLIGKDYKTYLKEQSIHLSRTVDSAIRSTNSGLLSNPKKNVYPFRFRNDENFSKMMEKEYNRSNGYLPVYAVRSDIANIAKGVVTPSDECWEK